MNILSSYGTNCHINNTFVGSWKLTISQDTQTVWSRGPRPQKQWSFVDSGGHFHAYSDGKYPTLTTRIKELPCTYSDHDHDCSGANETTYHCTICDERIEPGLIHGDYAIPIHGHKDWEVEFFVSPELAHEMGHTFSIRGKIESAEFFGVATIREMSSSNFETSVKATGVSQLGTRG